MLDASALLALLNAEPGGEIVLQALKQAAMSTVNVSEVVAKLAERRMPEPEIREALEGLGIEVHPFDQPQAFAAGWLRAATREQGLSLGDRACLALGRRLGFPVLTADRTWLELDVGVQVEAIR